jgi:hypothetical protein
MTSETGRVTDVRVFVSVEVRGEGVKSKSDEKSKE